MPHPVSVTWSSTSPSAEQVRRVTASPSEQASIALLSRWKTIWLTSAGLQITRGSSGARSTSKLTPRPSARLRKISMVGSIPTFKSGPREWPPAVGRRRGSS